MTFSQRGELLEAMSKSIHAARETLIEIGQVNGGNTRGDAKFDIDGATGTLMYYAKLGAKLGDRRILADGDAITGCMQGQHVMTTKPGVAVHINAFNFPVWGLPKKQPVPYWLGYCNFKANHRDRLNDVACDSGSRSRRLNSRGGC